MSFTQRGIELQRFFSGGFRFSVSLRARHRRVHHVNVGKSCVGQTVVWVQLNGLLETTDRLVPTLGRKLIPEPSSFQVELVCFHIVGRTLSKSRLIKAAYFQPELLSDGLGYLILTGD